MNSFTPWIGGKKLLRKEIHNNFPTGNTFDRYIEVFGGAGWLLFYRDKHAPFEVYNDINGELVNLFRCVKAHPQEMVREIDFNLISRERFCFHKNQKVDDLTDIQRAGRFLYLIKYSFCANINTFGAKTCPLPSEKLLEQIAKRLERVIIENNSYEKIIKQYDRTNSLFYCDPPYYKRENFYNTNEIYFTQNDHEKLRDSLTNIKGYFILSYNDDEYLRSLYEGFKIKEVTRGNNMTAQTGKQKKFKELIITNY